MSADFDCNFGYFWLIFQTILICSLLPCIGICLIPNSWEVYLISVIPWWRNPKLNPFYFWQIKTIKVSNVSMATTEKDIKEFFSFSGDIKYVEMQRSEPLQCLYLSFFFLSIFMNVIVLKFWQNVTHSPSISFMLILQGNWGH